MPSNSLKQKTALITGITGQDGSYLAELLLLKGYRVVGIRRRTSSFNTERVESIYDNPNFIMEWGNMTDTHSLWRVVSKYKPDEVYNLAAQSHVRVSFDVPEETLDVVGGGTLKLLNVCKEVVPDCRFYQASSSEMFGSNPEAPQNEDTALMPASPYACAKVYAHHICNNYREGYKMHISSGILFNHESPRRGETFVTRKITQAAARIKQGKQQTLYLGNLDAKRDWGFAGDFVEAMWLMLQQDKPDDYVIATGESHSVLKFLELVFDIAELKIDDHVKIDPRLFRPQEVPLLLGDASKATRVLGWKPKYTFDTLARMMYEADYTAELNNFRG